MIQGLTDSTHGNRLRVRVQGKDELDQSLGSRIWASSKQMVDSEEDSDGSRLKVGSSGNIWWCDGGGEN